MKNSVAFHNLTILESGYGISLRPLAVFAKDTYTDCDDLYDAIHKAITIIMFKLEGQTIRRHPEYDMNGRLLLDKIDYESEYYDRRQNLCAENHLFPND